MFLSCVFRVTNMNMQDERFWTLVSLKLNDEAGPEELAELEKLLILDPERGMQVQVLQSLLLFLVLQLLGPELLFLHPVQ